MQLYMCTFVLFLCTMSVVMVVPKSASSATAAVRVLETNCGGLSFTSCTVTVTGAVVASAEQKKKQHIFLYTPLATQDVTTS